MSEANLTIEDILDQSDREAGRFSWEGTFADYLRMVVDRPSISRLSHARVYDAIMDSGSETGEDGEVVYGLFRENIYGLERALHNIVQYFSAAARRLESRRRILLLLGPPASGKSTIVSLIKSALEEYTRTDAGAVYAIAGCPMQEEPLHLIPEGLRPAMLEQYGVYIEGSLCPRCRHLLRSEHGGRVSDMPVKRVTFSDHEAVGMGYYVATNPNPDVSLLVGSVNTEQLEGDRTEVAGRAFRLDGELNVANRGMVEFVEIFKADPHLLTTLLGLAQELVIKMDKFGSVYADEVIVGHSNEGDFNKFASDTSSEALKDRIIAAQIPYNLRVNDEVRIYEEMIQGSTLQKVHVAPLTLRIDGMFSVLSRLVPPSRQGMSMTDKLRLYDGEMVTPFSRADVIEMQHQNPNEGMSGISPRYVMNRLGEVASQPGISCITPLGALDSMWRGLDQNISLGEIDVAKYVAIVSDTVREYGNLAIREIQRAYDPAFDDTASRLLDDYLEHIADYLEAGSSAVDRDVERDMRELERSIDIAERSKDEFRREIHQLAAKRYEEGSEFIYSTDPRLRVAIESRLFLPNNKLESELTEPRFSRQKVSWAQRLDSILERLQEHYGYCSVCSRDLLDYVAHLLKGNAVVRTPKNEDVEWLWPLDGSRPEAPAS
jgi:serine protein kinase